MFWDHTSCSTKSQHPTSSSISHKIRKASTKKITVRSDHLALSSVGDYKNVEIINAVFCWKFLYASDMRHETLEILARERHVSRNHINPCAKTPWATKCYFLLREMSAPTDRSLLYMCCTQLIATAGRTATDAHTRTRTHTPQVAEPPGRA